MRRVTHYAFLLLLLLGMWVPPASAQFTIPDNNAPGISGNPQSGIYNTDINGLVLGIGNTGVSFVHTSSCQVTAGTNLTLNVGACVALFAGVPISLPAQTVVISTPNSTLPRLDLITVDSSGTYTVTAGTPAPCSTISCSVAMPSIPNDGLALATVFVKPSVTAIVSANIVDKRVPLAFCSTSTIEATCYGAVPDGVTDSTAALQEAVAAVQDMTYQSYIHVPSGFGCYTINQPILIHGGQLPTIRGDHRGESGTGTCIVGTSFIGPVFHLRGTGATPPLTTTTSLATGSGVALAMTKNGQESFIDFDDAWRPMQLNGLSAFTVQLFIKPTAITTDFRNHVLESSGSLTDFNQTKAYEIEIDTSGHLVGGVNVNGTLTEITSAGTLTLNTIYYVELSYDGSTVRLFYGIPGATVTLAGSTSASGTVKQGMFEQQPSGGANSAWPHGALNSERMDGAMDSIRFSNIARHTSTFTAPTAKHTFDGNTLLLENFDNITEDFSIVPTSEGTAYLPLYGHSVAQGGDMDLGHLELVGNQCAIFMTGVVRSAFHDLVIRTGLYGINSNIDVYQDQYERIDFVASVDYHAARGGFIQSSQGGITHIADFDFSGYPAQILSRAGSGIIETSYFHGQEAVIPIVLREGQWVLSGLELSNEENPPNYVANLYADSDYISIVGGDWEHESSTVGSIQLGSSMKALTVVGTQFDLNSGQSKVVELLGSAPTQPIVLINTAKDQAGVPWATDGHVQIWPATINTAPTITSGFGSTPSIVGTSDALRLTVGSGGSATTGVIAMPPAVTGWNCVFVDQTTNTKFAYQSASSSSSVTLTAPAAWTAADVLVGQCKSF